MTTYPIDQEFGDTTYHFTHNYTDSSGNSHSDDGTHFESSYVSYYRHRGGGNSPDWPRSKSTNGFVHSWLKAHKEPIHINFSNSDPHQGSYIGDNTHPTALPTYGTEGSLWTPRSVYVAINREKIVNKLLSNLSQNKVNIAQFIAEREQTANLVASTARRIAQAVTNLRRGNLVGVSNALFGSTGRGIRRAAGGIPEQWLALQYGWKPLLQDVYGSCEELAALTTGVQPEIITVNASARTEIPNFEYVSGGDGGWLPPVKWKSSSGSVSGKGSIVSTVTADFVSGASRTGLINPLTLGWELLPYSFVVDWFLPVGDFLQRCNASDGLTFLRGWIAQKWSMQWRATIDGSPITSSGWSGSVSGANHTAEFFDYEREALSWFPRPGWPSFKDPFSPTHVANALSLLATAFGRGPRVR